MRLRGRLQAAPTRHQRFARGCSVAGRAAWAPRPRVDNAMVKALARAFRWRKMLDDGVHATLEELARAKGVHATYVSRVLRLTLIPLEIVEAILAGGSRRGCSWMIYWRDFRWSGRNNALVSVASEADGHKAPDGNADD